MLGRGGGLVGFFVLFCFCIKKKNNTTTSKTEGRKKDKKINNNSNNRKGGGWRQGMLCTDARNLLGQRIAY